MEGDSGIQRASCQPGSCDVGQTASKTAAGAPTQAPPTCSTCRAPGASCAILPSASRVMRSTWQLALPMPALALLTVAVEERGLDAGGGCGRAVACGLRGQPFQANVTNPELQAHGCGIACKSGRPLPYPLPPSQVQVDSSSNAAWPKLKESHTAETVLLLLLRRRAGCTLLLLLLLHCRLCLVCSTNSLWQAAAARLLHALLHRDAPLLHNEHLVAGLALAPGGWKRVCVTGQHSNVMSAGVGTLGRPDQTVQQQRADALDACNPGWQPGEHRLTTARPLAGSAA